MWNSMTETAAGSPSARFESCHPTTRLRVIERDLCSHFKTMINVILDCLSRNGTQSIGRSGEEPS